jgi:hypothetical protein
LNTQPPERLNPPKEKDSVGAYLTNPIPFVKSPVISRFLLLLERVAE